MRGVRKESNLKRLMETWYIMGKPLVLAPANPLTLEASVSSSALGNHYGCFLLPHKEDPQIDDSPSQPAMPPLQSNSFVF